VTAGGQNVPVAGVTINWSKTGTGGSFIPAQSQTNAQGVATTQFTVATLAATVHTVTATDASAGQFTGTSAALTVIPAAAAKYRVSHQPSSPSAGLPVNVTAQLTDAFDNVAALAGRTVTWTATGAAGGSFVPLQTQTDGAGGAATVFTPSVTPGVVYNLTAADGQGVTGSAAPFTTVQPVALRLETGPPAALVNGSAAEMRVLAAVGTQPVDRVQLRLTFDPAKLQVVDADGVSANGVNLQSGPSFANVMQNTVNNATGNVSFTASTAGGQSPASGDQYLGSLWVRGIAVGRQTVSFDGVGIEVTLAAAPRGVTLANGVVDVRAKGLRFVQQPVRGAHGVGLGVQPVVAITDGTGAVVAGDSATLVTLRIRSGTGAGGALLTCGQTVGGVTQATAAAGIATFSGCAINLSGADYQLEATTAAPDVASGRTGRFNVSWAGDTDGNCRISVADVSLVVTHYGRTAADAVWTDAALRAYRADLDGDGRVGVLDFSMVVSRFAQEGTGCAPASNPAAVSIAGGGLQPQGLTIQAGQTVVWANEGPGARVIAGDGGLWTSGMVEAGQRFAHIFVTPGVFAYTSTQPGNGPATGTVTVLPGAAVGSNPN
ncbi:MAG: hypothetical protein NTZ05_01035, partial [Chloroflexi bacterium]|nr:hypothetical protein [Chloroflexota bacterium]